MLHLQNLHDLPRQEIERTVEALIEHVDSLDGDYELEPSLDDEHGTWPESRLGPAGFDKIPDENREPYIGSIDSWLRNDESWAHDGRNPTSGRAAAGVADLPMTSRTLTTSRRSAGLPAKPPRANIPRFR
jgi:hypothetical protein